MSISRHLLLDRPRLVLRLVEHGHQAVAAGQRVLGGRVELGAELGEGLQVAELRELQLEAAGHLAHGPHLGVAAHPATEMPTFTAGRTPEKKSLASR